MEETLEQHAIRTAKQLQKEKAVRIIEIGIAGYFVISRIMGLRGYKMVKPSGQGPNGEALVRNLRGKKFWIDYN